MMLEKDGREILQARELNATEGEKLQAIVNIFAIIESLYPTNWAHLAIVLCKQKRMSPHSRGLENEIRAHVIIYISITIT